MRPRPALDEAQANNLWQWKDGNLLHMVERVRSFPDYRPMPIIFTEDDGVRDPEDHTGARTGDQPVRLEPRTATARL